MRFLKHPLTLGIAIGVLALILVRHGNSFTSSDRFCESCHIHPQATSSWKQSTHYSTRSGMVIHCVECHLPPGGLAYVTQKTRLGVRDLIGKLFKDPEKFDWEARSQLEHAKTFTFRESCVACHGNLFPMQLSDKGEEAHLYYERKEEELRCINCHLSVGHYDPDATTGEAFGITATAEQEIHDRPAVVEGFTDFTEQIPGTSVDFEMVAVPGGTFTMGSPQEERYRRPDEGPARQVRVSSFWMGRIEVTWDEFEAWFRATASEGRTDTRALDAAADPAIDAVTGATPPYVPPDQGWGRGARPAITMTHHAALAYCEWLSGVTGRRYRLPTEAEWEYACRGGTDTPYFFEGDPRLFTRERFWNRVFGSRSEGIDPWVMHAGNSGGKTHPPGEIEPNPFGLVNMIGNVREFCLDWYAPDAYASYSEGSLVVDPTGPPEGSERVVRGGSFRSDPAAMRSAGRDRSRTEAWLMTDPQIPKSLWWYSDCIDVGFRVVCEPDDGGN